MPRNWQTVERPHRPRNFHDAGQFVCSHDGYWLALWNIPGTEVGWLLYFKASRRKQKFITRLTTDPTRSAGDAILILDRHIDGVGLGPTTARNATVTVKSFDMRSTLAACVAPGLFADLMTLADGVSESCVESDVEHDAAFNLTEFLERLETEVGAMLSDESRPVTCSIDHGKFSLNPRHLARFAWCCMTDQPAGTTFRGMPILN